MQWKLIKAMISGHAICVGNMEKTGRIIEFDPVTGLLLDRERGCRRDLQNQGLIACKPDDAKTCELYVVKDYPLKKLMETYADTALYIWERHPDGTETEEYREGKDFPEDAGEVSATT